MKINNANSRQTFLTATFFTIFFICNSFFSFSQNLGAPYGSRNPHTCPDATMPQHGAISAAQAKQYVTCGLEGIYSYQLYLVEDVSVTVGAGVAYNARNFPYDNDIDPNYPVYPIRVSFKQYQCGKVNTIMENAGKNCTVNMYQNATGVCVRTTFGDWRCSVNSRPDPATQYNMPPPR